MGILRLVLVHSIVFVASLVLSGCASTPEPRAGSTEVNSIPSLLAYYPLDGDAKDASGNDLHGVMAEATGTRDRFGRRGQALYFDGTNDFLRLPVDINVGPCPQLTLVAWVKPDGIQDKSHILSHDSGGYDRTIEVWDVDGLRQWSAFAGNGRRLEATQRPPTDEWTFVAAVYDQQEESVVLWVNDQGYKKRGALGRGFPHVAVAFNINTLGAYRGAIDDIRIYNRALTEAEIRLLYLQQ